jgi:hypothetical protein
MGEINCMNGLNGMNEDPSMIPESEVRSRQEKEEEVLFTQFDGLKSPWKDNKSM